MSGSAEVEQSVADGEEAGEETAESGGRRLSLRRAAPPATPSSAPAGDTTTAQPAAPTGPAAGVSTTTAAATPEKDGEAGVAIGPRWEAFAPPEERQPSRIRRWLGATGAALLHEWTLVSLGGLLLAALMTWPTLRHPTRTIPQDIWDPTLQAWQMAWSGHALKTDPTGLWQSNTFFPERYTFAFSDTLLGYVPFGLIGTGPTAAILRYNIVYVLAFALAFVGAYALVRQLGATKAGAAAAGAAFAYAPWRLGQAGHLHVMSTGGIVLSLAMLARGHGWSLRHGYRPDKVRTGWIVGGWLVAAWQMTLSFGVGLPFAYVLLGAGLVAVATWALRRSRPRPVVPRRVLVADVAGGFFFALVGGLMALPFLRMVQIYPYARRDIKELSSYSPPLHGFFIAPPESAVWGHLHAGIRNGLSAPPEMAMLPGFMLYGLALAGLFVSVWTVRQRIVLGVGVVLTILLAMGTHAPLHGNIGYLLLYRALPGFDAIRTPGRLVMWTTLLLGILAAGAVGALGGRAADFNLARGVRREPGPLLRLTVIAPFVLVLLEGLSGQPHPTVPPAPAAMKSIQGPVFILPSRQEDDENYMLWSTDRFLPMVNGGSGFTPHRQSELRDLTVYFPDARSIAALREIGVKTVLVDKAKAKGSPYEPVIDAPVDGLGITREDRGDVVVFTLN